MEVEPMDALDSHSAALNGHKRKWGTGIIK